MKAFLYIMTAVLIALISFIGILICIVPVLVILASLWIWELIDQHYFPAEDS